MVYVALMELRLGRKTTDQVFPKSYHFLLNPSTSSLCLFLLVESGCRPLSA